MLGLRSSCQRVVAVAPFVLMMCFLLCVATAFALQPTEKAYADNGLTTGTAAGAGSESNIKYYYDNYGRKAGIYKDAKTIELIPGTGQYAARSNYRSLNAMLAIKGELTIVIPSGSNIHINGKLTPSSNKTIIATGATITMKPKTYVMMTDPNDQIHDLTIIGGTWRSPDAGGRKGSMFQFAFAKNIMLDGVDVNSNFNGHSIEIIACENVTVQNCKVRAIGANPKNCKEEQIQIDISTKKTAPMVAKYGAKWAKGQTCKNIFILNNEVYGARAVGVNYYRDYKAKYHKNIVIKGNKLHATTSEAIQYFNVVGGEISDNIIRTDATRKTHNRSYTVAVHIQNNGKAPSAMKKSKIIVARNTIYGNRNGIYVLGYFTNNLKKCPGRFGTIQINDNVVYCKDGKKAAINQTRKSAKKWKVSGNKTYKWNKKVTPIINLK